MLAIYTRLSREDSESTSIENQLREGYPLLKIMVLMILKYIMKVKV